MQNRLSILILPVLAWCGAGSLVAHTIDRQTSFLRQDVAADALLVVDVLQPNSPASGAKLEVLDALRSPVGVSLERGAHIETRDRIITGAEGRYGKGVCLAFLQYRDGIWYSLLGPSIELTRPREEWKKDKAVNFLGSIVSREQVIEAAEENARLAPAHLDHFDPERRVNIEKRLRDGGFDPSRGAPLADERAAIWERWAASDNPLLTISALVDAYEVASEGFAADSLTPARPLPDSLLKTLQKIGTAGLAHGNPFTVSAALAVLERVGFPPESIAALTGIVAAPREKHLTIVRQEAIRALGALPGLGDNERALILAALSDETLRDEINDFPAQAVTAACRDPRNARVFLARGVAMLEAEETALWFGGVRLLAAAATPEAYSRLRAAYAALGERAEAEEQKDDNRERPGMRNDHEARRRALEAALRRDAHPANLPVLEHLLARAESSLTSEAVDALDTLAVIGSAATAPEAAQETRRVVRDLLAVRVSTHAEGRDDNRSLFLYTLARMGDADALTNLFRSAAAGPAHEFHALRFLEGYSDVAGTDKEALFDALAGTVRESAGESFRRSCVRAWVEHCVVDGAATHPTPRDLTPPEAELSPEMLLLGALAAKDRAPWEERLARALPGASRASRLFLLEMIERLRLRGCADAAAALEVEDDERLGYLRARALDAVRDVAPDAHKGVNGRDGEVARWYRELNLTAALIAGSGPGGAMEDMLRGPAAAALLPSLIGHIGRAGDHAALLSSRAAWLLSRLTGNYEGFLSSLSLDRAAMERLRERWRRWYANNEARLRWDEKIGRFSMAEPAAADGKTPKD